MIVYRLLYFFDAGSGTCLWSANESAREKFDYPVDINDLPLCENTKRRIIYITAWYDTSLDWSDPSGPSPWDVDELLSFNSEAQKMLHSLRTELGNEFELVDESRTSQ